MTNLRQRRLPFKGGRSTRSGHRRRGQSTTASLPLRTNGTTSLSCAWCLLRTAIRGAWETWWARQLTARVTRDSMAYEVMQRTPLLVRWMAVGSLALLLGLTVTEDKSYRRQELQKARGRVMLGINQIKINQQKEVTAMKRHPAVLLGNSLFFAAAVLAGCATEPNAKAVS